MNNSSSSSFLLIIVSLFLLLLSLSSSTTTTFIKANNKDQFEVIGSLASFEDPQFAGATHHSAFVHNTTHMFFGLFASSGPGTYCRILEMATNTIVGSFLISGRFSLQTLVTNEERTEGFFVFLNGNIDKVSLTHPEDLSARTSSALPSGLTVSISERFGNYIYTAANANGVGLYRTQMNPHRYDQSISLPTMTVTQFPMMGDGSTMYITRYNPCTIASVVLNDDASKIPPTLRGGSTDGRIDSHIINCGTGFYAPREHVLYLSGSDPTTQLTIFARYDPVSFKVTGVMKHDSYRFYLKYLDSRGYVYVEYTHVAGNGDQTNLYLVRIDTPGSPAGRFGTFPDFSIDTATKISFPNNNNEISTIAFSGSYDQSSSSDVGQEVVFVATSGKESNLAGSFKVLLPYTPPKVAYPPGTTVNNMSILGYQNYNYPGANPQLFNGFDNNTHYFFPFTELSTAPSYIAIAPFAADPDNLAAPLSPVTYISLGSVTLGYGSATDSTKRFAFLTFVYPQSTLDKYDMRDMNNRLYRKSIGQFAIRSMLVVDDAWLYIYFATNPTYVKVYSASGQLEEDTSKATTLDIVNGNGLCRIGDYMILGESRSPNPKVQKIYIGDPASGPQPDRTNIGQVITPTGNVLYTVGDKNSVHIYIGLGGRNAVFRMNIFTMKTEGVIDFADDVPGAQGVYSCINLRDESILCGLHQGSSNKLFRVGSSENAQHNFSVIDSLPMPAGKSGLLGFVGPSMDTPLSDPRSYVGFALVANPGYSWVKLQFPVSVPLTTSSTTTTSTTEEPSTSSTTTSTTVTTTTRVENSPTTTTPSTSSPSSGSTSTFVPSSSSSTTSITITTTSTPPPRTHTHEATPSRERTESDTIIPIDPIAKLAASVLPEASKAVLVSVSAAGASTYAKITRNVLAAGDSARCAGAQGAENDAQAEEIRRKRYDIYKQIYLQNYTRFLVAKATSNDSSLTWNSTMTPFDEFEKSPGDDEKEPYLEPLGIDSNPLGLEMGFDDFKTYRGAIVGNFLIFLMFALVALIVAVIRHRCKSGREGFRDSLAKTHFYSSVSLPVCVLFPATIYAIGQMLMVHQATEAGSDKGMIGFGFLYAFIMPLAIYGYICRILKQTKAKSLKVTEPTLDLNKMNCFDIFNYYFYWLMNPLKEWKINLSKGEQEAYREEQEKEKGKKNNSKNKNRALEEERKRREQEEKPPDRTMDEDEEKRFLAGWKFLFETWGIWYFPVFDLSTTFVLSIVGGVGASCATRDCCTATSAASLVFASIHLVLQLWYRPHLPRFDSVFVPLMMLLTVGLSGIGVLANMSSNPDGMLSYADGSTIFVFAASWVGATMGFIANFFIPFLQSVARNLCKKKSKDDDDEDDDDKNKNRNDEDYLEAEEDDEDGQLERNLLGMNHYHDDEDEQELLPINKSSNRSLKLSSLDPYNEDDVSLLHQISPRARRAKYDDVHPAYAKIERPFIVDMNASPAQNKAMERKHKFQEQIRLKKVLEAEYENQRKLSTNEVVDKMVKKLKKNGLEYDDEDDNDGKFFDQVMDDQHDNKRRTRGSSNKKSSMKLLSSSSPKTKVNSIVL